ncbi:MAG TPA: DUF3667 domain-containing protein [Saprospiraceae bacterium]|nr:DUF3667 domain-containing protein [Saprospiraceae bacterium]
MICKNCNNELHSKYCPDCGQSAELKRIDGHYIIHEIEHVLHFERGIFFTIKELCLRPRLTIETFIKEDRSRLVKPVIFIIFTSLIYTLSEHFFHLKLSYMNFERVDDSSFNKIFIWMQEHYGYANILIGIFIAIWIKILFRKHGYNYFEILVMLCYTVGIQMLLSSLFVIAEGVTGLGLVKFAGLFGIIYLIWAIGEFFGRKPMNYFKALVSMVLGNITTFIMIILFGLIIDVIIH